MILDIIYLMSARDVYLAQALRPEQARLARLGDRLPCGHLGRPLTCHVAREKAKEVRASTSLVCVVNVYSLLAGLTPLSPSSWSGPPKESLGGSLNQRTSYKAQGQNEW